MSLINSLVFGSEGSYSILGIPVTFHKESRAGLPNQSPVIKLVTEYFNKFYYIISQEYLNAFMHEMGHALTAKLFSLNSKIVILTNSCNSETRLTSAGPWKDIVGPWKGTVILASGPMSSLAFSTCKLALAIILKNYIPPLIFLVLNISSLICIARELIFVCNSISRKDTRDYGLIAQQGNIYLALAIAALLTEYILAAFIVNNLISSYL